jgi:hypothetical protein
MAAPHVAFRERTPEHAVGNRVPRCASDQSRAGRMHHDSTRPLRTIVRSNNVPRTCQLTTVRSNLSPDRSDHRAANDHSAAATRDFEARPHAIRPDNHHRTTRICLCRVARRELHSARPARDDASNHSTAARNETASIRSECDAARCEIDDASSELRTARRDISLVTCECTANTRSSDDTRDC